MSDKPLTDISFSSFNLQPALLAGLENAGFSRCTPIQALTLPITLAGRDVAGQAQTGTGKTLAFLVTVVNRLLARPALADRKPEDPRALILAPTRELAIQIHKDAVKFGADLGLKFALVYGGVDYDKQRQLLQEGADVIIATPGRLIDYVKQHKVVSLHACEICVLDEADRMFDLGFIKDIRFLLRRMPVRTERQTLLFSATLSKPIVALSAEFTRNAKRVDISNGDVVASTITHRVHPVAVDRKRDALVHVLTQAPLGQALVFCKTRRGADRVGEHLERAGLNAGVIHSSKGQGARNRSLADFKSGRVTVLVATDIAARGLDVAQLPLVVNYDLPLVAEDYVHRVGRTGRAGLTGRAVSLVSPAERPLLNGVQRLLGATLEQVVLDNVQPTQLAAAPIARPSAGTDAGQRSQPPSGPRGLHVGPQGRPSGGDGDRRGPHSARQPHRPGGRFQPAGGRRFTAAPRDGRAPGGWRGPRAAAPREFEPA